jgi:hypothetical protein
LGNEPLPLRFGFQAALLRVGLLPNCLPRRNRAYPMFNGQADRFSPQRHAAVFRLPFGCRADGV